MLLVLATCGLAVVLILACVWWFLLRRSSPAAVATSKIKLAPSLAAPTASSATAHSHEDDASKPALHIFYASQTGTAEAMSKSLVAEARKRGFRPKAVDLQDSTVQAKLAAGGLALFLVATYGEGDPTDNARDFVKWLKAAGGEPEASGGVPPLLAQLTYAVFGLGNRQYEHFNSQGVLREAPGDARGAPLSTAARLPWPDFFAAPASPSSSASAAAGKLVDERLAALGAARLLPVGLGDDDGTLDEDHAAWKDALWPALLAHQQQLQKGSACAAGGGGAAVAAAAAATGAPGGVAEARGAGGVNDDLPEAPVLGWDVVTLPPPADAAAAAARAPLAAGRHVDLSSRHYYACVPVPVAANRELRQAVGGPGDSTRHIELDLGAAGLAYATADNLYVCPENEPAAVAVAGRLMGYDLSQWFTLEPAAGAGAAAERDDEEDSTAPRGDAAAATGASTVTAAAAVAGALPPFPVPCTVRDALARYCDLAGPPRRELVRALAFFAGAADDRASLVELAGRSAAGKARWAEFVVRQQRSVLDLLVSFPSVRLPLAAFVQVLPRLMPRAYTIASSTLAQPATAALCVRVIDTPKPGPDASRRLTGVCSSFLAHCAPGGPRVCVYVRASSFRLPPDPATPVILVGPGTGIAPMRAFLQERAAALARGTMPRGALGDAVLFFGCQHRAQDFIYADELTAWEASGALTRLYTAFSRDGPSKVYVQHLIRDAGADVWGLLSRGAHVYVCGATSMGHDVLAAFEGVHESLGGLRPAEAKASVKALQAAGRYVQELWS